MRSPGFIGVSDGATTCDSYPASISRCRSSKPVGPASSQIRSRYPSASRRNRFLEPRDISPHCRDFAGRRPFHFCRRNHNRVLVDVESDINVLSLSA
jgi:hypothetical protein